MDELEALDRGPALRIDLQPDVRGSIPELQLFEEISPAAALVIASARDSATLVRALRESAFTGSILGGPQMGRRLFLATAAKAGEGVTFPLLFDSSAAETESFGRRFRERTGWEPDWATAHTYDAVCMLLQAIGRADLNRVAIRQALVELSPWSGVTGIVEWDPTGQNRRPVTRLGTIQAGQVVPAPNHRLSSMD